MRRTVFFVLGAIVLQMGSAGIASANDEQNNRRSHWELECRFLGEAGKDKGTSVQKCTAVAKVCELGEDHHGPRLSNDNDCRKERLAVACDGTAVYNDGARTHSQGDFEYISGFGGTPVIKFPSSRHDHDRDRDRSFVVSAWLNLNGQTLEGFCSVEKVRDGHDLM